MSSRLAQLDAQILAQKQEFDRVLQFWPRVDREWRLCRWHDFLSDIAPLVAEREALLLDVSIPDIAAHYDPLLDSIRQWRKL